MAVDLCDNGADARDVKMLSPDVEELPEREIHRVGDGEVKVDDDDSTDLEEQEDPNAPLKFQFRLKKLLRFMGPGWLMSLAYLDPGNLESDLQQGAYTGFSLVWVLWWATVMGLILQELAARLGVVTGMDLAEHVRSGYPRWLNYAVYVNMEIAVIASDIQEVVGCGIAIYLLSNGGIPVWAGCIITGVDTFTFLGVQYFGVRYLEAFICILITTMCTTFFVNWGQTHMDPTDLLKGWVVPIMHTYGITQAIATIGAVIMPHNLYLHSGLVQSRQVDRNSPRKVHEAIWYHSIESALALFCSFVINLAIVATNAGNFYNPVCAEHPSGPFACLSADAIGSVSHRHGTCELPQGKGAQGYCSEIGLQGEGAALMHGLGWSALYIWAIGLLAAGQAATMTCTYAGQIIMGGCVQIKLKMWQQVAFTRGFALGPAIVVAALTADNDKLFNDFNEWLNVLQSLQLPFAMLPLLHFCSRSSIMGRFRSGLCALVMHFALAALVMVVNVISVLQFVDGFSAGGVIGVCIYAAVYLFVCIQLVYPCALLRW